MGYYKRHFVVLAIFFLSSCAEVTMDIDRDTISESDPSKDSDQDTVSPVQTDSDGIVQTDGDTESDTATDTAVDTDTNVDTESDTMTDSGPPDDTESDTEEDSESDTDPCQVALSVYDNKFEHNDGGFITVPSNGIWIWGEVSGTVPASGHGKVWATGLDEGWYGNCDNAFLTSTQQDLSECAGKSLTLSFDIYYHYHYLDGNDYQDGLLVELFDSSSWVQITPNEGGWDTAGINAGNCGIVPYVNGKPGFAGKIDAWTRKSFTVSFASYAEFKFRFVHGSDNGYPVYGAYIDNVRVTAH